MSEPCSASRNSAPGTARRAFFTTSPSTVGRGEVVALMGRNGAGKSTTLKAIMGLIAKRRGAVRFNGEDISRRKPFEIARRGLGYTPEDRRIFSDLTVMENLDIGRQPPRTFVDGRPAPSWTAEKLFALFPNLAAMPDRLGDRMSGGEQQMLTVARTLMGNPLLVLLDEPSEGVAPLIVEQMAATIVELKKEGLSILLSEQNIHFARLVVRPRLRARTGPNPLAGLDGTTRRQPGRATSLSDGVTRPMESTFFNAEQNLVFRRGAFPVMLSAMRSPSTRGQ